MRLTRRRVAVLLVTALGLVALAVMLYKLDGYLARRHAARAHAQTKYHQLCLGSKIAMRTDRDAFLSNDEELREEALSRFYEGQALYHSAASLLYCTDKLPELPPQCWLDKDWACLARVADQIERSLPD